MSHPLQSFLEVSINNPNGLEEQELKTVLPEGWHKFVPILLEAATLCGTKVMKMEINDGVLYVEAEHIGHIRIFGRVARSLSQESALTCMSCGIFGRRRK